MRIVIDLNDDVLRRYGNQLGALSEKQGKLVMVRALNRAGRSARTQVVRALSKQTGLKQAIIRRAVRDRAASFDNLSYELSSRGGDVALKYFAPRETRRGVSAAPWGKRRVFQSTFLKGGRFPQRVPLSFGGHVMERDGSSRLPISKVKSGLYIPREMIEGSSHQAFERNTIDVLHRRMAHEIGRLLTG